MIFKNINPNKFLDELIKSNIKINGNMKSKKLNIETGIAEEIDINISENDKEKVIEISNKLIGVIQEKEPSESEVLMSNIILENATLKQQMIEQQELSATLVLQIAELKGGNTDV